MYIGTLTYSNGDRYDGDFSEGKKNGQGIMTSPNGEKYDGEWKDDRRDGNGTAKPHL